jgi:hypothetical protein
MKPTNLEKEKKQSKVSLLLDPDDIKFLANEWRKIPEDVPKSVSEAWARIAFRASTALHKSGIDYEPEFPDESMKYKKS